MSLLPALLLLLLEGALLEIFINLSSFVDLGDFLVKSIFWGLFAFVMFFQVMFSGIIKTKRPSLLG